MSGQAYSIAGRALTRADLRALTERETTLLTRYKTESATGGMAINTGLIRRSY